MTGITKRQPLGRVAVAGPYVGTVPVPTERTRALGTSPGIR